MRSLCEGGTEDDAADCEAVREAGVVEDFCEQRRDALAVHVHAIHFPIGGGKNTVGQMVADKTIHP